jgi:hypothetical protein
MHHTTPHRTAPHTRPSETQYENRFEISGAREGINWLSTLSSWGVCACGGWVANASSRQTHQARCRFTHKARKAKAQPSHVSTYNKSWPWVHMGVTNGGRGGVGGHKNTLITVTQHTRTQGRGCHSATNEATSCKPSETQYENRFEISGAREGINCLSTLSSWGVRYLAFCVFVRGEGGGGAQGGWQNFF